jgi:PAS domain-containing protein
VQSSNSRAIAWWARLLPRKLATCFGMAVCAAVLLTEAVFLLGASQFWRSSHQAQAIERVREAWYHASDPASFMTPEQVTLRGERMVRDGLLLGGMIYDSVGDPLAVFGQRPNLRLSLSRLSGVSVQRSSSASAVDAHLSPQQTGLAHHLIVRLPSGPIDAATSGPVREFGLSVLIIAGFSALLVMLASFLLVIRPLRAINNALREAVLNPDQADRYQLPVRRQDELGQIAGAMNMLFNSVSVVYQDELASMQRAIEGFGFAILQYDHEGRMIAANPSAMTIFNVQDFMALRSMNRNCASPLGAKTSMPQPLPDLLGRSDKPMLVTIHMDEGYFTAMAYSVAIRRGDGAPSRHLVAVMPMDDMMRESRRAIIGAKKSDAQVRSLSLEVQEMRRLLESCLCLLEPAPKSNETAPLSIMPDRILNSWYSEAARDGLVAGKLEHGLLPPMCRATRKRYVTSCGRR